MKVKIAFFLSLVFLSLISCPTLLTLVDDNKEITSLVDNTEEENKNEELEKDIEFELKSTSFISFSDLFSIEKQSTKVTVLNYVLELSKKNTPPPEFV